MKLYLLFASKGGITMFFIETNMGFDHGCWWWHNINHAELEVFSSYEEAEQRKQELLQSSEVTWAEIRS